MKRLRIKGSRGKLCGFFCGSDHEALRYFFSIHQLPGSYYGNWTPTVWFGGVLLESLSANAIRETTALETFVDPSYAPPHLR